MDSVGVPKVVNRDVGPWDAGSIPPPIVELGLDGSIWSRSDMEQVEMCFRDMDNLRQRPSSGREAAYNAILIVTGE
jgi:hypothetical protein